MQTLSLIVKGDRFQAALAAADRGIPAVFVRQIERETILQVSGAFRDYVARWFHEPGQAPFPPGTLLSFAEGRAADVHDAEMLRAIAAGLPEGAETETLRRVADRLATGEG
jgi:hypothetical protein